MTSDKQMCSTPGCGRPAVFRTRSKPSWCGECIDEILRIGGMKAIEPVQKATTFTLMECLECGTHTHNRLEYVVGNNSARLQTCRACHWREWGAMQRSHLYFVAPTTDEVRTTAEENGFEYLGPLTNPSQAGDPHHVRCRHCGRLTAERQADIGFGCPCSRNGKSAARATVSASRARTRTMLFKDSDAQADEWWDHTENSEVDYQTASIKATREVAWKCPTCSHRFTAPVREMVDRLACPRCEQESRANWQREYAALKRTSVAEVPLLAAAWDDPADPATVPVAGHVRLYRLVCQNGHHPRISPHTFLESGCPHCRAAQTRRSKTKPRLAQEFPEIAAQWHPTRNGRLTANDVGSDSKRTVWWRDSQCGHEWSEVVAVRNKYRRDLCPRCHTILDSLAYQYPLLAAEWSPNNPLSAWQVRPHGTTSFEPEWVCPNDPSHVWKATLSSRTTGSDCPECREAGKSRIELDYLAAAKATFGRARSGAKLQAPEFHRRPSWTVDITVPLKDEPALVIEYDGSYWHRDKAEIDRAKSMDLLAAGYRVVRLRENPLQSLHILDPRYTEVTVYADAPTPGAVMTEIKRLISG